MSDREQALKVLFDMSMIVSKTNLLKSSSEKIKDQLLRDRIKDLLVECESVQAYLQCKLEIT